MDPDLHRFYEVFIYIGEFDDIWCVCFRRIYFLDPRAIVKKPFDRPQQLVNKPFARGSLTLHLWGDGMSSSIPCLRAPGETLRKQASQVLSASPVQMKLCKSDRNQGLKNRTCGPRGCLRAPARSDLPFSGGTDNICSCICPPGG